MCVRAGAEANPNHLQHGAGGAGHRPGHPWASRPAVPIAVRLGRVTAGSSPHSLSGRFENANGSHLTQTHACTVQPHVGMASKHHCTPAQAHNTSLSREADPPRRFRLPAVLPPSFRGSAVRFTYVIQVKAVYEVHTGEGSGRARPGPKLHACHRCHSVHGQQHTHWIGCAHAYAGLGLAGIGVAATYASLAHGPWLQRKAGSVAGSAHGLGTHAGCRVCLA